MNHGHARATAHANIALAKYWGKADPERNLPAVPSLSMTLDGLRTTTDVYFDTMLATDELVLDGVSVSGRPLERATAMLDRVRASADCATRARVESANDFPTASGLASSASGFAALAVAASRALGLHLEPGRLSALARASSASAARSIFGGFVALGAGASEAEAVAPPEHWDLRMVVAVTEPGPKAIGSTRGMDRTAATSPYYPVWLSAAPPIFEEVRRAVLAREIEPLGEAVEHSALLMHASMMAARPSILYFAPSTLSVIARVRQLREDGLPAYFTMDAGPHVKVLTLPRCVEQVENALAAQPGVHQTIRCGPGPEARAAPGTES